ELGEDRGAPTHPHLSLTASMRAAHRRPPTERENDDDDEGPCCCIASTLGQRYGGVGPAQGQSRLPQLLVPPSPPRLPASLSRLSARAWHLDIVYRRADRAWRRLHRL